MKSYMLLPAWCKSVLYTVIKSFLYESVLLIHLTLSPQTKSKNGDISTVTHLLIWPLVNHERCKMCRYVWHAQHHQHVHHTKTGIPRIKLSPHPPPPPFTFFVGNFHNRPKYTVFFCIFLLKKPSWLLCVFMNRNFPK